MPDLSGNWVALLGTKGGPAIRHGSTNPTAHLLALEGQFIVVDCGLGVTRALVDQGMALRDLSLVFITHLHSDHYLELGPMLHTAWTAGLKTQVAIWGPPGIDAYWQAFCTAMAFDIETRISDEGRPDLRQLVQINRISPGLFYDRGGLAISALRAHHPPLVDCFALRFAGAGRVVVFSGDTTPLPEMIDFAGGADLLIHEAMLAEGLAALVRRVGNGDDRLMQHLTRSHSLADQVAQLATQAKVGALALNHLIPSDDPDFTPAHWLAAVAPHWNGPFHLGYDGLRIPL